MRRIAERLTGQELPAPEVETPEIGVADLVADVIADSDLEHSLRDWASEDEPPPPLTLGRFEQALRTVREQVNADATDVLHEAVREQSRRNAEAIEAVAVTARLQEMGMVIVRHRNGTVTAAVNEHVEPGRAYVMDEAALQVDPTQYQPEYKWNW